MPKVIHKMPPKELYQRLQKEFGPLVNYHKGLVLAYGHVIYAKNRVPGPILAHETVHCTRQLEMGLNEWWEAYITDPNFRLEEEKLAYKAELNYYKSLPYNNRLKYAESRALILSSQLYGNLITYRDAVDYLMK